MTQVDFYAPVADKLAMVHRLSKKALDRGWRVMLWTHNELHAQSVSDQLWSNPPTSFLPHVMVDHPQAADTGVLIACSDQHASGALPHHDMLINFTDTPPAPFARFERLVELVGPSDEERQQYRERYRWYRERGYKLNFYELEPKA
ncbi:DNA polymerase III subunit chi [Leeia oryzae]|uniref:DNA polymerase III subunit chi n=1 Tax=Leeia oryzae TaxID=356662 RepID=UPI00037A838E|nr:DNA polymerase III subunit chi [Leeia oryzae]